MQAAPARTTIKYRNPSASEPLILPVYVVCNTSDELLRANITENSRRPGTWVQVLPENSVSALLCGSGPSLADSLPEIRERVRSGARVFALNGAAQFLYEHGITSDYQVMIDARERTASLVGPARQHLFASQCHPSCWDKAPDARIYHLAIENIEDLFPTDYPTDFALIGGAASVGNTATCLAYALGYRDLHCFGYDSSHRGEVSHARHQAINDADPVTEVDFHGKTYRCSITMKLQAEKFPDTAAALESMGAKVTVHGDGLLPAIYNTPASELSERDKYQRMWNHAAYRGTAPGEHCVDTFLEIVKPVGTVIDFGCGTGRAGLALDEAGLSVVLMDFTDNSRDEKARHLPFMQHDLTQPIPLVAPYGFCTDVMEHIPPQDVSTVLRNICDATDTAFFQICTVPDDFGEIVLGQPLHLTVQPHEWWREQLQALGEVTFERKSAMQSIFVVRQE